MTARAWRMAGGLCLLLACEGGTAPSVAPGGGGDGATLRQTGDGGARAAGTSSPSEGTAGGASVSGSAPGVGSVPSVGSVPGGAALERAGAETVGRDLERDIAAGGSGGAGSGGRGFGGNDTGRGHGGSGHGGSGHSGSGAGSDDDDDDPAADGERRYAVLR